MSWDTGPEWGGPRHSDAVLLAAGMADLAAGALGSVVGGLRGLLRRSDAAGLAGEGQQEIKARGRLVLDRCASGPPAHLEVLARHVTARRRGAADVRQR
ncbi:polyprenyl synthetase [Streptomyces chryseus]